MLLRLVTRFLGCLALFVFLLASPLARAQSWTTIPISFYPGTMLLMTDGTVLVHYVSEQPDGTLYSSGVWMRLTPDAFGNYTDGTWSQLPTMPSPYAPRFHATAVLPDGRVLVEGGEYNTDLTQVETTMGAIYDPVSNAWTSVNPPSSSDYPNIGDAQSVVLPNGTFMLGDCCGPFEALFDASNLTWPTIGNKSTSNAEEGWVLLPNGKVLTVDLGSADGTTSELYDPSTGQWSATGTIPVQLEDTRCDETGPMVLQRNGTVFAVGGAGFTATYAPSSGQWTEGPFISGDYFDDDGPATLLPDGNVFFQVSYFPGTGAGSCYGNGSEFFEWNGSTLVQEPGPPDEPDDAPSYEGRMLMLPTGQVLYDDAYYDNNENQDKNLFLYTPSGTYQASWQPQITSVPSTLYTNTVNNSISGIQFNGQSQGSMYGDDEQMAENFPLVYIKNISTGHIFYCRTHNFSTMGVATGSTVVSAQFDIPGNAETGASDIVVVADGIPSPPVSVDVEYGAGQQNVTVSPTSLSMYSRNGSSGGGTATLTNNGPGTLGINGVLGGWRLLLTFLDYLFE
ncbi:MAG: hypothetical protein EPN33_10545 [Acidobacteria bacterium]|nr:MAG: hypothetical protein EPN33_10545 [Acidobacteriota bacterium]